MTHTDNGTDHFGHDDHVAQVSLDNAGLLTEGSLLLGTAKLLDQSHRLALQTWVTERRRSGNEKGTPTAITLLDNLDSILCVDIANHA